MLRRHRSKVPRSFSSALLALLVCVLAFSASSSWRPGPDPAQWTSDEIYRVLHDSPWTKSAKVNFSSGSPSALGRETPASNGGNSNGNWGNNGQMPGTMGGRRGMGGMGGNSSSGTYGSGGGRSSSTIPDSPGSERSHPTDVTVQWQSALPVQLAEAKKGGAGPDSASVKPADDYVIAVIGLPAIAVGGRAASVDSDSTINGEEEQRMASRVKSSAALLRPGHDPISADKVEVNQGADGRILIHFPKTDPITAHDKSVEFRLATDRFELRKKFALKEMEYNGKLEL